MNPSFFLFVALLAPYMICNYQAEATEASNVNSKLNEIDNNSIENGVEDSGDVSSEVDLSSVFPFYKDDEERSIRKGFNAWAGRRALLDELDERIRDQAAPKRGFNAWAGKKRFAHGGSTLDKIRLYQLAKRRPWGGVARI